MFSWLMPSTCHMGDFYAGAVKTMALALFYGPAMPISYFIAVAALMVSDTYAIIETTMPVTRITAERIR